MPIPAQHVRLIICRDLPAQALTAEGGVRRERPAGETRPVRCAVVHRGVGGQRQRRERRDVGVSVGSASVGKGRAVGS